MSIITSIKSLFTNTAGTPVAIAKFKSHMFGKVSGSVRPAKEIDCEKINEYASFVVKCIRDIFISTIFFVVLAHFVPELRQQLPDFYFYIDLIMSCFNWIFAQIL